MSPTSPITILSDSKEEWMAVMFYTHTQVWKYAGTTNCLVGPTQPTITFDAQTNWSYPTDDNFLTFRHFSIEQLCYSVESGGGRASCLSADAYPPAALLFKNPYCLGIPKRLFSKIKFKNQECSVWFGRSLLAQFKSSVVLKFKIKFVLWWQTKVFAAHAGKWAGFALVLHF